MLNVDVISMVLDFLDAKDKMSLLMVNKLSYSLVEQTVFEIYIDSDMLFKLPRNGYKFKIHLTLLYKHTDVNLPDFEYLYIDRQPRTSFWFEKYRI
jgi:hypothetical protein